VQQEKNRLAALSGANAKRRGAAIWMAASCSTTAGRGSKTLSDAPALADGAELITASDAPFMRFDRRLVASAGEHSSPLPQRKTAICQFVTTTRSGQLLRVQMAPVRASNGRYVRPKTSAGSF
jgi:DNA polymerase-3 subunit epsilon